jgi:hypothetical protein
MILLGWVGLGTSISNHRLVEVKDYRRPQVAFVGHPVVDSVPRITGLTEPRDELVRYGAVFDALHQGRCLAYWLWTPPLATTPGPFAPVDITISLEFRVQLAVNRAREGGAPQITIDAGNVIGSCNGQPMIAGQRLAIEPGTGLLVAHAALAKAEERRRQQVAQTASD